MDGMDMDLGMGGGMMLWMLIWGLVGLALLVLAVLGIVWLVRRTDNPRAEHQTQQTADEVLKRRYAAGEIDEDEYLRRRAGLT